MESWRGHVKPDRVHELTPPRGRRKGGLCHWNQSYVHAKCKRPVSKRPAIISPRYYASKLSRRDSKNRWKRILRILGCRNELGEREGKDRVVIARDVWRTIKGNWFPMFHLTTLKCTFNLECCVAVSFIVPYLLLCCSFNEGDSFDCLFCICIRVSVMKQLENGWIFDLKLIREKKNKWLIQLLNLDMYSMQCGEI